MRPDPRQQLSMYRFAGWRRNADTAWRSEAPYHTLQQALKDLDRAYKNFFAQRADFPTFQEKGCGDSFRFPHPKQIKLAQATSRIFRPKRGWLRYRNSREALGDLENVTVSLSAGKWFISIQTERQVEKPVAHGEAVGIDVGIVRFVTLSDGTVCEPFSSFSQHRDQLRKAQQAMSRKKKFSSNWKKAKAKVRRIHVRIANARRDYLHKALYHHQQKPRDGLRRGFEGEQYVPVRCWHGRTTRQEGSCKGRAQQVHPRSGLG